MNTNVDNYFIAGCGRCKLYETPQCKVHKWAAELKQLRELLVSCGLDEVSKWGMPCYTFRNKNVILLSAFNDYCSINFFKGSLLQDEKKLLSKQGENVQDGRLLKFTNSKEITKINADIKAYIYEAIALEEAGIKPPKQNNNLVLIEELVTILNENPSLKKAFEALTPGRQRGYNIHFSSAKQSKTRIDRIEKCTAQILAGKGFFD